MRGQQNFRRGEQAQPLSRGDRRRGVGQRRACLHLHDGAESGLLRNKVDLAGWCAQALTQDVPAIADQRRTSRRFRAYAQRMGATAQCSSA
jgi:hypothetical protein